MDKKQTLQNVYKNDFWYEYIGYLKKSTNYVPCNHIGIPYLNIYEKVQQHVISLNCPFLIVTLFSLAIV